MKKFVLLCGLMLSVMHISATDFTYNELNYSTVSENTCEVVSVSQDLTSVEIPAEAICDGTAYKVVGVAAKAFDAAKSMTTITFPATLEYLANGSFFKTTKLKNITCLATTPPDISASPFASGIYTASTLTVPEGCFLAYQTDWIRFSNIVEPGSVTVTVDNCKYTTISEKDLTCKLIAGSPKYSGDFVVPEKVTINDKEYKVVELGRYCFDKCADLTSVSLPSTLQIVNIYALRNCTKLTKLELPESVVFANTGFCYGNTLLEEVKLSPAMTIVQNVAFQKCNHLKRVDLPENCTYINASAFAECSELETVTGGSKITEYASGAFKECFKLKNFALSPVVELIGVSAFQDCHELPDQVFPETLKQIDANAFFNSLAFTKVELPNSVTTLGNQVFGGSGLKSFRFSENITKIGTNFLYQSGIEEAVIPECLTTIPQGLFANCFNLKKVTMHNKVTTFGTYVFQACNSLEEFEFPESVETIGGGVFMNYEGIKEVVMHDKVTSVGNFLFQSCTALTDVTLSKSLPTLSQSMFVKCSALEQITIPESVTKMGNYVFKYCSKLKSVVLPEKLDTIGKESFMECTALENVYLPDNLTGLSVNLFKNCPALASITLRGNMKWINAGVFDGCTALKEVKSYNLVPPVATATSFMDSHYTEAQLFVPDEAADAYKNDEVWKNFINRPTGVESVDAGATFSVNGRTITINASDADVMIVNMQGIILHNGMMQAGESINLDSNGVYLIKLNDKVSKFIVR